MRNRSPPARAGGTAGRWAFPRTIATNRSPPTRPIRVHKRQTDGTSPAGRRAVGPSSARLPQTVHHQPAQSAIRTNRPPLAESLRKLGAGPCHLAGRSLWASCPPLARCWLVLGIPAFTSPATPARLARARPSRTRIPRAMRNRSPPARAGGTAGRWAFPRTIATNRSPPIRPIRVHKRQTDGTSPAARRAVGHSRPPATCCPGRLTPRALPELSPG
jgi:hypothetical protein